MARFLVFAATGQVGSELCARLIESKHDVSGVTRSEKSAESMAAKGITPIVGDVRNLADLGPKISGFDGVFLASADATDQDKTEIAIIEVLKSSGSPHVVKLSAQSAGLSPAVSFGIQHLNAEKALISSGLPHTILRPTFFQQSLLLMSDDVARKGSITAPMGGGRVAMVDVRDIADVAAIALTDPAHQGKIYTLTGPAAYGLADVTEKLSALTGRRIKYVSPPAPIARLVMPFLTGMPRWKTRLIVDLMTAIKNGAQEPVSGDVEQVTGQKPRDLDAFLKEQLSRFQP